MKNVRILTEQREDGSKRWLDISAAYDRREEGYGIHGAEMRFGLEKEGRVIVLRWMTPFFLSATREHLERQGGRFWHFEGLGSVDLHSPTQLYSEQKVIPSCPFLQGKDCFCDRSSLQAGTIFDKAVEDPEAVWTELEGLLKLWTEEK